MITAERITAYHILRRFDKTKARLDILEESELIKANHSAQEIRHIKNLTSGVLRNLLLLDYYSSQLYKGNFQKLLNKIKIILRMGLYELNFMPHVPAHAAVNEYVNLAKLRVNDRAAKLVNAILRNFQREKDKLKAKSRDTAIEYSFPDWLIGKWRSYWGVDFTNNLCAALDALPTFDVRVNPQKISTSKFEKLLDKQGIEYEKSSRFAGFYKIKKIAPFFENDFFEKGFCSIQDESAAIPVQLLDIDNNDQFLDVCAAPGGKFTQVLEQVNPQIAVAVDSSLARLKRVKQNLQRLGLQGYLIAADARYLPFKTTFSKILIDAPCSGQGVIGKHPDIKWRRTPEEIAEFSHLQKDILESSILFLSQKGKLVYSTCSIDKSEDEDVVDAVFAKDKVNFKILNIAPPDNLADLIDNDAVRTFPHLHRMDGSYAVLIGNS